MPILAPAVLRRRLSSRGGERRLIPKWSVAVAGLRRKRERVKAGPVRSGCGELELAQGVEGAFADLARDGQSRHGVVASFAGGAVELEVGGGCAVRVHGGLDERPTWEGPASQGRRSTGSHAEDVFDASWVALPYMGARCGGAGGRIGAAAAHSRPGQRCRAGRFVGARRKLFRRWGRCSHGIGQAACSSSARTWWARRAILRATVRAARLLPLRSLPAR